MFMSRRVQRVARREVRFKTTSSKITQTTCSAPSELNERLLIGQKGRGTLLLSPEFDISMIRRSPTIGGPLKIKLCDHVRNGNANALVSASPGSRMTR